MIDANAIAQALDKVHPGKMVSVENAMTMFFVQVNLLNDESVKLAKAILFDSEGFFNASNETLVAAFAKIASMGAAFVYIANQVEGLDHDEITKRALEAIEATWDHIGPKLKRREN